MKSAALAILVATTLISVSARADQADKDACIGREPGDACVRGDGDPGMCVPDDSDPVLTCEDELPTTGSGMGGGVVEGSGGEDSGGGGAGGSPDARCSAPLGSSAAAGLTPLALWPLAAVALLRRRRHHGRAGRG